MPLSLEDDAGAGQQQQAQAKPGRTADEERARISAITKSDKLSTAAQKLAAVDLALKSPDMSAADVADFVASHVAAQAQAESAQPRQNTAGASSQGSIAERSEATNVNAVGVGGGQQQAGKASAESGGGAKAQADENPFPWGSIIQSVNEGVKRAFPR